MTLGAFALASALALARHDRIGWNGGDNEHFHGEFPPARSSRRPRGTPLGTGLASARAMAGR